MAAPLTAEVQATEEDHAVDTRWVIVNTSFVRALCLLDVADKIMVPIRKPALGSPQELNREKSHGVVCACRHALLCVVMSLGDKIPTFLSRSRNIGALASLRRQDTLGG